MGAAAAISELLVAVAPSAFGWTIRLRTVTPALSTPATQTGFPAGVPAFAAAPTTMARPEPSPACLTKLVVPTRSHKSGACAGRPVPVVPVTLAAVRCRSQVVPLKMLGKADARVSVGLVTASAIATPSGNRA